MSFRAKRELLVQVAPRYRAARHGQRSAILDEFVAVTGYERKYAIRLLLGPIHPPQPIRRPRAAHYGVKVQQALTTAWTAANGICGKRLVPFLPELVPTLERHGHLSLTDAVRTQLLTLSPATADRLLAPVRQPHGLTTTKPGRLLKKQIPVRTFTEWTDAKPGFLEADLVAHCGGSMEGAFLYTLTLTDVATTWTECLPLLHRSQHGVVHALQRARGMFPFPLLGIDTDNGSEFINEDLLAYCADQQLTFTRGRVANKNDQCWVELCGYPHNSTYADFGIMPTRRAPASCSHPGGRHNHRASRKARSGSAAR
jgi:Integrase core domain